MTVEIRVVVALSPSVELLLLRLAEALENRRRDGSPEPGRAGAPGLPPDLGLSAETGPSPQVPSPVAAAVRARGSGTSRFGRNQAWRTAAREAAFRAGWSGEQTLAELHRALCAMDGPAMPGSEKRLYAWAFDLGLGERPGRPRPTGAATGQRRVAALSWRTAEREAVLRARWVEPVASNEIHAELAAMPGPEMPSAAENTRQWGAVLRLGKRPVAAIQSLAVRRMWHARGLLPEDWRTPEREAVLRARWHDPEWTLRRMRAAMMELPGGEVPEDVSNIGHWARALKLAPRQRVSGRVAAANAARGAAAARARVEEQDTGAGVAGAAASARPPTEARGMTPAKAAEEEAGPDTGAPTGAVSVPPAPQPIGRPPNTSGEPPAPLEPPRPPAAQREAQPTSPAAQREAQPTSPAAQREVQAPRRPPPLPAAQGGRVYASFAEIKAWAAHFDIRYNGANVDAVNRRRSLMGLPPVVQDEARTRGAAA